MTNKRKYMDECVDLYNHLYASVQASPWCDSEFLERLLRRIATRADQLSHEDTEEAAIQVLVGTMASCTLLSIIADLKAEEVANA